MKFENHFNKFYLPCKLGVLLQGGGNRIIIFSGDKVVLIKQFKIKINDIQIIKGI